MSENRPSNENAPRVPGEEGGRKRWPWLLAGLVLLLLLALLIPFACQSLSGDADDSGQKNPDNTSKGEKKPDKDKKTKAGAASDDKERAAEATIEKTTEATTEEPKDVEAVLSAVAGRGDTVTVSRAEISGADGWIAVHAESDGKPGEVLGFAPLKEGANEDIEVRIDAPENGTNLYAMIHRETPADGDYTFPDGDPPVEADGQPVVERLRYETASKEDESVSGEGAEDKPLPDSGGLFPSVLIFAGAALILASRLPARLN